MVFPPVPAVYLDPHPPNWQQQQGLLGGFGSCSSTSTTINNNHHHQFSSMMMPMPPPPAIHTPPTIGGVGSTGGGSVRPGSMAERARLAKLPQPEAALKCPRCESTNTKFCYFNNYSLTQPRHFCKTCRRYWTRGGALRNVPVGGGCRRNKRSKRSSRSKSPQPQPTLPILITPSSSTNDHRRISTNTTTTSTSASAATTTDLLPHNFPPPIPPPFFFPLDNLNSTIHHDQFGINADIGLNFNWKLNQQQLANFVSSSSGGGGGGYGGSGGGSGDQFEHGLCNYIGNLIESHHHHKSSSSPSSALEVEASHLASVLKLQEDNSNNHHHHQDMIITDHLSRNFSESSSQDHQYWTNTTGINNSWITNLSSPSPATGHEHLI